MTFLAYASGTGREPTNSTLLENFMLPDNSLSRVCPQCGEPLCIVDGEFLNDLSIACSNPDCEYTEEFSYWAAL